LAATDPLRPRELAAGFRERVPKEKGGVREGDKWKGQER